MGKLVSIFHSKQQQYIQRRHENTTEWQKTKAKRIEKFLYFCESRQIKDLHKIQQKHFDEFVENLVIAGKSTETVRKYSMAVKEFCVRAHIKDIKISPNKAKKRKITKKVEKIVTILQRNNIKIDDTVRTQIAKIL